MEFEVGDIVIFNWFGQLSYGGAKVTIETVVSKNHYAVRYNGQLYIICKDGMKLAWLEKLKWA